jgi:DNA processing protein
MMPERMTDQPSMPTTFHRYSLQGEVVEIDTASLGFTNSVLLRVPKLFAVGDLSLFQLPAVALVGSRKASQDALKRTEQLAHELVEAGIVVMSGLAFGIDGAAHRGAIRYGGRTTAVIGTPVDRASPAENAGLQQEIAEKHLLISPFAIGTEITRRHFPERNRVMARLALATVILEAGDTSGSLHQAAESVAIGRPLYIAEAVARNGALKWPARFIGKPFVHVLTHASDLIDTVLRR